MTASHVFLGYKPVLIAMDAGNIPDEEVCLHFTQYDFTVNRKWRGFDTDKNCIARLQLKKIAADFLPDNWILYEGVYGEHHFLNAFYRFLQERREAYRKKQAGNISLEGNLYDQVRIVYAVPRNISLITVGDHKKINLFPTDLHGNLSDSFYVSSLRIGGKANAQVEIHKRIVLSAMPATLHALVYGFGRNHMQDEKDVSAFPVKDLSLTYTIPFPADALRYKELELLSSLDAGIHRIHLYGKTNQKELKGGQSLAHIHQYYAEWQMNHGYQTKMLLRS